MNFKNVNKSAAIVCCALLLSVTGSWAAEKGKAKAKPVVRKIVSQTLDLRSKIGKSCLVCYGSANANNTINGTLVNVSDQWIVVRWSYSNDRAEYWFPVNNIRYITFDVVGKTNR